MFEGDASRTEAKGNFYYPPTPPTSARAASAHSEGKAKLSRRQRG